MARRSDALRVHHGKRCEVIEAAHGIPELITCGGVTEQQHLFARGGVLGVHALKPGVSTRRVRIADSFTLSHGIERQYHEPQLRQSLAAPLIVWIGFTFLVMATLKQDSRERSVAALGDIEICRNEQVRPALVYDFFDSVFFPFKRPSGACV